MKVCSSCGAELETPLACSACGALFSARDAAQGGAPTPFAILGLPLGYALDRELLRRRLLAASRSMHPDFFAGRPEQALAEENTALLNAAHALVADDARRAEWLVRHAGGPSETEERSMPQAFLLEVMDWNEALEEARASAPGSRARAALAGLERDLRERRRAALGALAELLDPLPAAGAAQLRSARQQLNAVRYLDRALEQLAELRLESESSAPRT